MSLCRPPRGGGGRCCSRWSAERSPGQVGQWFYSLSSVWLFSIPYLLTDFTCPTEHSVPTLIDFDGNTVGTFSTLYTACAFKRICCILTQCSGSGPLVSAPDPNPALSLLVKDFHSPGGEGGGGGVKKGQG